MTKNIIIVIIILVAGVMTYLWLNGDSKYKQKIEAIEKERDSIVMQFAVLEYKNDSIIKLKRKVRWRTEKTTEELKKQEHETDAIPGIVATYTNRKLDSILSNHRHKPRTKSRDSINNPNL